MPLVWVLLVVMLFTSYLTISDQTAQDRSGAKAEISAISLSMLVYRNAVANFVQSNSAFVGVIPDGLLALPAWYVKPQALSNYVVSGKSYTFYSNPLPGLAGELARKTESINVGTKQNGVLLSPKVTSTGFTLPVQIPNGSVVLIQ